MVVTAAAMMISSTSHQYTIQNKIFSSPSLKGAVRIFDMKMKKSSAPYKGVQVYGNSPVDIKINGTVSDSLNVNNNNVGLKDFVEEERRIKVIPNWLGRFLEDSLVFRQNFAIRSYEIGPDKTISIETLMNHLQETALNCVLRFGLAGDGFGTTLEMSRRNLIWVVARSQFQVDTYPSWGDIVEIDTWVDASGKNGMRWDWIVRDIKTNDVLIRATSTWVMINKKTRKLSKIPNGVREELQPYFTTKVIGEEDTQKLIKLDDSSASYISSNLTACWSDLDANQHVNNIKYISWILESIPVSILQNNELASITLEYRRECMLSHTLQSLSSPQVCEVMDSTWRTCVDEPPVTCISSPKLQFMHLLRLQDNGLELLRARTKWRPKRNKKALHQLG